MAEYLTTKEVARYLRLHEKKVYALVAQGKLPAARISGKWLFPKHLVDQWVEQNTVLPTSGLLGSMLEQVLVLQGSDDWLLSQVLEGFVRRHRGDYSVVSSKVGSVAGLGAVARGQAHLASCHVDDEVVRSTAGNQDCYILHLFDRQQGLIYNAARHPGVTGLASVAELDLTFALRQPLSGTHRLVQGWFEELGIDPQTLRGVGPFSSHTDLALAVRSGRADAGVGIQVAAEQCGLDFIPLCHEPFKLVVPTSYSAHPKVVRFFEQTLDHLGRAAREHAPGYRFERSGTMGAVGRPAPDEEINHVETS
jgi:putative molybdopterin biosynthesis protein